MAGVPYQVRMIREINRAISDFIGGAKSATITTPTGTRSYTRPEMSELITIRDQLKREIALPRTRRRVMPDFGFPSGRAYPW